MQRSQALRALLLVVVFLSVSCFPPSDERLISLLENHEQQFVELKRMMDEDSDLRAVAKRFYGLRSSGPGVNHYEPGEDLTAERWGEYRRRLRSLGIKMMVRKWNTAGQLHFYVATGSAFGGIAKGIAHLEEPPNHTAADLDHGSTGFRRVRGNWYLFSES